MDSEGRRLGARSIPEEEGSTGYTDAQWARLEGIAVRRGGARASTFQHSRLVMNSLLSFAEEWPSVHDDLVHDAVEEPKIWGEVHSLAEQILEKLSRIDVPTYEYASGVDPRAGTFEDPAKIKAFSREIEEFSRHAEHLSASGPPVRRGPPRKTKRDQVWAAFADVWTDRYQLRLGQGSSSPAADFLLEASRPIGWLRQELTPDAARGFIRWYAKTGH